MPIPHPHPHPHPYPHIQNTQAARLRKEAIANGTFGRFDAQTGAWACVSFKGVDRVGRRSIDRGRGPTTRPLVYQLFNQ